MSIESFVNGFNRLVWDGGVDGVYLAVRDKDILILSVNDHDVDKSVFCRMVRKDSLHEG